MLVIRLARTGAKKRPFYHIVAADSRSPRDGRFIERLGYFNPIARGKALRLHIALEKVEAWLKKGAKLSNRVASLIKEAKNPNKKYPQEKTTPAKEAMISQTPSQATMTKEEDKLATQETLVTKDNNPPPSIENDSDK